MLSLRSLAMAQGAPAFAAAFRRLCGLPDSCASPAAFTTVGFELGEHCVILVVRKNKNKNKSKSKKNNKRFKVTNQVR